MKKSNQRLDWCIVHLRKDSNWWIQEISDEVNWDVEGLSIIDPNQFLQIHESLDSMTEFGLDSAIVDNAFFTFGIDEELPSGRVRLSRVRDSLLKAEDLLFALPDIMDEEKGPYADFIKHVTALRVEMLNEVIDFAEPYTVDDLEEILREREGAAFMEGRHVHFNDELTSILEFVPDGFTVETDLDDSDNRTEQKEEYPELETVEESSEEQAIMEKKENLRWDEEETTEEGADNKNDDSKRQAT
ncbi:MAG: hypothetical protein VB980_04675 [Opitutales bacterium]|jgi:hypothetical protein